MNSQWVQGTAGSVADVWITLSAARCRTAMGGSRVFGDDGTGSDERQPTAANSGSPTSPSNDHLRVLLIGRSSF